MTATFASCFRVLNYNNNYDSYSYSILLCIGPKPGPPRNVSIAEVYNGFVISWQAPLERAHLVRYYVINYKTDGIWRTLNKAQIRAEDTRYLGTHML